MEGGVWPGTQGFNLRCFDFEWVPCGYITEGLALLDREVAVVGAFVRYHGGKVRMAPALISLMPLCQCYVEPFGGGAGVLLARERVKLEVYNDLAGEMGGKILGATFVIALIWAVARLSGVMAAGDL